MSAVAGVPAPRIWGLLAEFETPDELLRAARQARDEGYRRMDAHTPFPIHGLSDAMGFRPTKLPLLVLAGGLLGGVTALAAMWFSTTIHYPLNVAGKTNFIKNNNRQYFRVISSSSIFRGTFKNFYNTFRCTIL